MSTVTRITAWSYSRWSNYMLCPFKAKCLYIDRLKEPSNPAAERGDSIHKAAEKYLRMGGRLPAALSKLEAEYRSLRAQKPQVELELAFNADWKRVDWFAKDAWLRVKVDALLPPIADQKTPRVSIIDHKTGKLKEAGEYNDQLELYGLAGLLAYPVATVAVGELYFVDHGKVIGGESTGGAFPRSKLEFLQKRWVARTKAMLTDTRFQPRPGRYCSYCHFRKSNGGPCPY